MSQGQIHPVGIFLLNIYVCSFYKRTNDIVSNIREGAHELAEAKSIKSSQKISSE